MSVAAEKKPKMKLTAGAVEAIRRLQRGGRLLRDKNRSRVYWDGGDETLHHLTFACLQEFQALTFARGDEGRSLFTLSESGAKLLKEKG